MPETLECRVLRNFISILPDTDRLLKLYFYFDPEASHFFVRNSEAGNLNV